MRVSPPAWLAVVAAAAVGWAGGAAAQAPNLGFANFNYADGNTASLAGPAVYPDGLSKDQVAGVVIGCVLAGLVIGAGAATCWLKRRRLFPKRFGPPQHPNEAPAVAPIDVLRSNCKLDTMTREELGSVKSFAAGPPRQASEGTRPGNEAV